MEHSPVDRYACERGLLQRIPALWKFIFTILILFYLSIPVESELIPAIIFGIFLVLLFLSKIPPFFALKRLLFVIPFILFVLIMNLHQPLSFFLRAVDSVFVAFLFVATTPFTELLRLLELLRIPAPFLLIMAMGYRFFFLLKDEVERVLRAWKVRGGEVKLLRIGDISFMITSVLERLIKRAGMLSSVLKVRGYDVGT